MSEKNVCGCKAPIYSPDRPVQHSARCEARGWSAMSSKEEVEADRKQAELEELKEEAEAKLAGAKNAVEQVAVLIKAGLGMMKDIRPVLPIQEVADELRTVFGTDLRPIVSLFEDTTKHMLVFGSNMRADQVVALMGRTALSEESCVAIVNATTADLLVALKSGANRAEKDRIEKAKKR